MAEETTAAAPSKPPPTSFWQTLLVYPTLGLALAGSVPTIIQALKARRLDTSYTKVQLAEQQAQLWALNLDCIQKGHSWEVDGPDGLVVKVTLCDTGDALLRYYQQDAVPQFTWVARPPQTRK